MKPFLGSLLLTLSLLQAQELRDYALSKGFESIPKDIKLLKQKVENSNNPLTKAKILLGKKLFFDKNLSFDRTISCASCHELEKGGEDSLPTAVGYKDRVNPKHLNTPTVLNTAYSKHLFWDARASSLAQQAAGPMQASFEMNSTPQLVVQRVKENQEYASLFKQAFHSKESISFKNITFAIEAYEKTLVTRGAFDEYLDGDENALSQEAKEGLNLFIVVGCKACHFGPGVGGQRVQKFPLRDYNSIISITSKFNDTTHTREIDEMAFNIEPYHPFPFENKGGFMGKDLKKRFRVPILKNISQTPPYFHNGAIKDLKEAIKIMAKYQVGINLTQKQTESLEAFLKSLDGELVPYKLDDLE